MEKVYKEHQSGMPDANYLRMIAKAEYAWKHRMEPDPLEGFEENDSEPSSETEAAGEAMPSKGTINFRAEPTDIGNP